MRYLRLLFLCWPVDPYLFDNSPRSQIEVVNHERVSLVIPTPRMLLHGAAQSA